MDPLGRAYGATASSLVEARGDEENVSAFFLQHIARLCMQCAGELARTNGATVAQAMSWQNCLGACRYGAQTSQAEGFWHGRIIAYTGVGSIARDAPLLIANFANYDRMIRIVARARALSLSQHFVGTTVS